MSRRSRPIRRVRGRERDALVRLVCALLGGRGVHPWRGLSLTYAADVLHVRPAPLRRCLLGRPVSAHAALRVLNAARCAR